MWVLLIIFGIKLTPCLVYKLKYVPELSNRLYMSPASLVLIPVFYAIEPVRLHFIPNKFQVQLKLLYVLAGADEASTLLFLFLLKQSSTPITLSKNTQTTKQDWLERIPERSNP